MFRNLYYSYGLPIIIIIITTINHANHVSNKILHSLTLILKISQQLAAYLLEIASVSLAASIRSQSMELSF